MSVAALPGSGSGMKFVPRSAPVLTFLQLDVTLAHLKGKDDEAEDAQEHANSSSLALLLRKIDPLVVLSVNPLSTVRRQVAIGT
ncbi:MAG: hypothetical protein WBQ08_09800 [Candidatus Sulfotelmatobacter sp.]